MKTSIEASLSLPEVAEHFQQWRSMKQTGELIWQGFSGQKITQLYDSLFHSLVASDSRSWSGVSDDYKTPQYIQISLA